MNYNILRPARGLLGGIMFDYNKNRSKNTIITEQNGVFSLCLYRESQVLYSSNSLQDVLDFAMNKTNEYFLNLWRSK